MSSVLKIINDRYQEFATPDSTLCYKIFYGLKPVASAMDICYAKIRIKA